MTKADEESSRFSLGIFNLRPLTLRVFSFSKKLIKGYCRFFIFKSFNDAIVVGSISFFLLATAFAFLFLFPRSQPVNNVAEIPMYSDSISGVSNYNNSIGNCNVFEGGWIRDESYPLYDASQCPFAEQGFNCLANGRKDRGYTKWRWKPKNCEIPRFDVHKILEKLRGKRIVFVGDSLSRTQWESLICMLMTGVEDKSSVFEVNKNKITKQIRFLGVKFSSFDLRIDFYRSVFLVQPSGRTSKHAPKRVKSTLKLDKLDDISREWIDSDVLVFNSGHWWTPTKLFEMGCYFQIGGSLKLGMRTADAFRTAVKTWASWAETNINVNRTRVFFRTFESSHWGGWKRGSCKVTQQPSARTGGRDQSVISRTIMEVVKKMGVPVTVLHVTPMGAYRGDGHVGRWSDNPAVPDCSHWCLPGVPDMWNELLLSFLMSKNDASSLSSMLRP